MNIYQIDQEILNCIDETGEVIDMDRLMELQMEREQKCENVACWIVDLNAEVKAIREQRIILAERLAAAEAKAEQLKKYLAEALCGEKLKTGRVSVSYRKSTSTEIDEGTVLPDEYQRVKIETEPDKTKIKEALSSGADIPGCRLVTKTSVIVK